MNNNNPTGKAQNSSDRNYHPPFFMANKITFGKCSFLPGE